MDNDNNNNNNTGQGAQQDTSYLKVVVGMIPYTTPSQDAKKNVDSIINKVTYASDSQHRQYPCFTVGQPITNWNADVSTELANTNATLSASLSQVEYDKGMFRHGYVSLTFSFTYNSSQNTGQTKPPPPILDLAIKVIKKYFFTDNTTFLDLFALSPADRTKNTEPFNCTTGDIIYLVRNYYFQGYEVISSSHTKCSVVLKCYSPDRKLALKEYCGVYMGQFLATGLLPNEGTKLFDETTFLKRLDKVFELEKTAASSTSTGLEKERETTYSSTDSKLFNVSVKKLLLTGYQKSVKVKQGDGKETDTDVYCRTLSDNDNELRNPYLVQYNESLYDLIARTAHRCGEFFFFENGRITIGLPDSTRSHCYGASGAYSTKLSGFSYSFSTPRGEEASLKVASGSFSGNYADIAENGTSGGQKYSMDYYDEALHVVTDEDNRYKDFKSLRGFWMLFKALGIYCSSESFADGLTSAAAGTVMDTFQLLYIRKRLEKNFTDSITKSDKNVNGDVSCLKPNGKNIYTTTSLDAESIANLCNNYYHLVENWEKTSSETVVEVNTSSLPCKICLGESVTFDDLTLPTSVVVSMHGLYSTRERSHSFSAVPLITISDKKDKNALKYIAVPLSGQVNHIREVSPMEAEVTDTVDPLRLGRVRVKYPWQSETMHSADGKAPNPATTSPWLRVEVPFTGGSEESNAGFCMTPSVGEHVMLGYVGGNIEHPFVSGSLYYLKKKNDNGNENTEVYKIPPVGDTGDGTLSCYYSTDHKIRTIASGKGHALVFQDFKDTNLFNTFFPVVGPFLQAFNTTTLFKDGDSKDGLSPIKGGCITLRDGSGITTINLSPNRRDITIESTLGTVKLNAFTGITINAPNGDISIKGKNISLEAGNNIKFQAGKNITDASSAGGKVCDLLATVGLKTLFGVPNNIMKEETAYSFTNLFDLSLLRSAVETLLRPVEGTLSISSKRNVQMTAGRGKVSIPKSLMSKASVWGSKGGTWDELDRNKQKSSAIFDYNTNYWGTIKTFLTDACRAVNDYFDVNKLYTFCLSLQALLDYITTLHNQRHLIDGKWSDWGTYENLLDISKRPWTDITEDKIDTVFQDVPNENINPNVQNENFVARNSLTALNQYFQNLSTLYNNLSTFSYKKFYESKLVGNNGGLIMTLEALRSNPLKDSIVSALQNIPNDLLETTFVVEENAQEKFKILTNGEGSKIYLTYDNMDSYGDSAYRIKTIIKKYIIIKTLLEIKNYIKINLPQNAEVTFDNLKDYITGANGKTWADFLNLIEPDFIHAETPYYKDHPHQKKAVSTIMGFFGGAVGAEVWNSVMDSGVKLNSWAGVLGPHQFMDPGAQDGNVLISSSEGDFVMLEKGQFATKWFGNPKGLKDALQTLVQE